MLIVNILTRSISNVFLTKELNVGLCVGLSRLMRISQKQRDASGVEVTGIYCICYKIAKKFFNYKQ